MPAVPAHEVLSRCSGHVTLIRELPEQICLSLAHAERHRICAWFSLDSARRASFHLISTQVGIWLCRGPWVSPMNCFGVVVSIGGCLKVDCCRTCASLPHSVIGEHAIQRLRVRVDPVPPLWVTCTSRPRRHDSLDALNHLLASGAASSLRSAVRRGKLGSLLEFLRVDNLVLLVE